MERVHNSSHAPYIPLRGTHIASTVLITNQLEFQPSKSNKHLVPYNAQLQQVHLCLRTPPARHVNHVRCSALPDRHAARLQLHVLGACLKTYQRCFPCCTPPMLTSHLVISAQHILGCVECSASLLKCCADTLWRPDAHSQQLRSILYIGLHSCDAVPVACNCLEAARNGRQLTQHTSHVNALQRTVNRM